MKKGSHPEYKTVKVTCTTCGSVFESGSVLDEIRVDTCSNCHPFYTGKQAFTQADVILCPTAPDTAFKFGENSDDQVKMYMNDILTVTVNIVGLPAISIPCGFDSKGLPIGCQLIGDKFSEQLLLNTAFAYEKADGGFDLSRTLA